MISTEQLSFVFADVVDSLVTDFDLVEVLHNLTTHAAEVSGAAAVGLLLADQHGHLHFMAASTQSGRLLELFQLQNDQGPCLDCFRSREPVVNSDLAEASERWPLFAPRALAAGFRSVHAFPMRVKDRAIGALNIFGHENIEFEPSEVRLVQTLADVATIAILQESALDRVDSLTEQLQGALNSRMIVEQAKGAVAQWRGVGVDEAFELMRNHARVTHQRLGDLSIALLAEPSSVPALTAPARAS